MKTALIVLWVLLLGLTLKAGPLIEVRPQSQSVVVGTNTFNTLVTNLIVLTNNTLTTNIFNQHFSVNHTYEIFVNTQGTNNTTVKALRTIDGQNWVDWQSTNITSYVSTGTSATNAIEWTAIGKWSQVQFDVSQSLTNSGTNFVLINEMSQ